VKTFGADEARLEVLVFREGVLSAVGHDLRLRATDLEFGVGPAGSAVRVRVNAASLRVAAALRAGRVLEDGLSPDDVREIEATLRAAVLDAARFPEIRFASSAVTRAGDGWNVEGALTVRGTTRPIAFAVRRDGDRLAAEVPLDQPAFGIRPYRAMLGALRVKPEVRIRASIPAEGL
jgi:polyisoprenoid-binding protein YceI